MKILLEIKFVVLIMFVFSFSIFGQSSEKIERELIGYIENVRKNSNYGSDPQEDLLEQASAAFKENLLKYTKNAATLDYKFNDLAKHISIATSEDGKFRVYSWDTKSGGTMHFFETVYQFRGADGNIYSENSNLEEGDAGSFVTDVFDLETKTGKIYLARFSSILSTQDAYQNIHLYQIKGDTLNDQVKLIKTKSGLTNVIGFGYNFFSVVDRKERPIKLIIYDRQTKTIKIPVVIEDKKFPNGRVTNKFINYRFDGTYFVKIN